MANVNLSFSCYMTQEFSSPLNLQVCHLVFALLSPKGDDDDIMAQVLLGTDIWCIKPNPWQNWSNWVQPKWALWILSVCCTEPICVLLPEISLMRLSQSMDDNYHLPIWIETKLTRVNKYRKYCTYLQLMFWYKIIGKRSSQKKREIFEKCLKIENLSVPIAKGRTQDVFLA